MKKGTDLGKEIEGIMKEGNLVPTPITVKLLREAMEKSSSDTFLIDGFPREIHQAEVFEQEVKPPQLVIFYDCPEVITPFSCFCLLTVLDTKSFSVATALDMMRPQLEGPRSVQCVVEILQACNTLAYLVLQLEVLH